MSDESRIEYLKRFITECDHDYYIKGKPTIPDEQYDNIKRELIRLEEGSEFDPESPTQRVGAPIESGKAHQHIAPLLSLENRFTLDEVMKEVGRIEKNLDDQLYVVEDKLDGLTGCLTYINGNLMVVSTRGDGYIGESMDVIKCDVPHSIPDIATLDIVGEFVLPYEMLNRLNEDLDKPYESPRAAAVGLIRKNIDKLTFIAFSARYHDGSKFSETETDLLTKLEQYGFVVVSHSRPVHARELSDILSNWVKSDEYDCDGIVIKVDDIATQEELGNRKTSPRWGFAYKQNSAGESTVLRDVVWQVGCHGTVTPVGIVDPVKASKAIVSRATLHNPLMILSLGLVLGGGVKLIRSGEVIPAIIGRDPSLDDNPKPIPIPTCCPSCGNRLKPNGPELRCDNNSCPDRVIAQVIRIASADALDINGLGDVTALRLVQKGLVKTPSDLFKLNKEDMLEAGFTKSTTEKVCNALSDLTVTLDKLYYALCIPNIGIGNARVLAKAYPSIDLLSNATPDGLLSKTSLEMGEVVSVYDYFSGESIYNDWPIAIVESETKVNDTLPLRTWVITGTLETPRRVMEAKLAELNVTISTRVGKNIDCIIIGSNPTEHKVNRANVLGIKQMNEVELLDWIKVHKEPSHV